MTAPDTAGGAQPPDPAPANPAGSAPVAQPRFVLPEDVVRMVDRLLLGDPGGPRKRSAFWILLGFAGLIASAGVLMDSAATVIGAMIVAPLMTPILGTALALVLGDRPAMLRSAGTVVGGAAFVIAIGFAAGAIDPLGIGAVGNSQIAARVSPRLIDLVAALATGTIGAFALARSDVSDTLPGVAIAISLVPPLAVVGIVLQAGQFDQAFGALLLFVTNAAAIIATGVVVFTVFHVRDAARAADLLPGAIGPRTMAVVAGLVLLITVPLTTGTAAAINDHRALITATDVTQEWSRAQGWEVRSIEVLDGTVHVLLFGPPPVVDPEGLRVALDGIGLRYKELRAELVIGEIQVLEGVTP